MDAATEFELVSRICARARWSTSGEHAKAVREVIQQVRTAALEDGRRRALFDAAREADRWVEAGMHAVGNVGLDGAPTQGLENMRAVAEEIAAAIRRLK